MKVSLQSNSRLVVLAGLILLLNACEGNSGSASQHDSQNDSKSNASNADKVATLKSIDTVVGDGALALAGSNVSVHYSGWLYDAKMSNSHGAKFDSSLDRGAPFQFRLGTGQVIAGWDLGVVGMRVGGKRTLIIPSAQAYGPRGQGPIPPDASLIFDVELMNAN
jgi:FKBP-type peptidyl-prolyl cis-trans isomerase FkpA